MKTIRGNDARRKGPRKQGVIDWLLACPQKDFFVPIESASTDASKRNSRKRKSVKHVRAASNRRGAPSKGLNVIADLIGSVDGLPGDLSGRKKKYLKTTSYGEAPAR